jgi:hypothetical protein
VDQRRFSEGPDVARGAAQALRALFHSRSAGGTNGEQTAAKARLASFLATAVDEEKDGVPAWLEQLVGKKCRSRTGERAARCRDALLSRLRRFAASMKGRVTAFEGESIDENR